MSKLLAVMVLFLYTFMLTSVAMFVFPIVPKTVGDLALFGGVVVLAIFQAMNSFALQYSGKALVSWWPVFGYGQPLAFKILLTIFAYVMVGLVVYHILVE